MASFMESVRFTPNAAEKVRTRKKKLFLDRGVVKEEPLARRLSCSKLSIVVPEQ
jgi:hypothetical protein